MLNPMNTVPYIAQSDDNFYKLSKCYKVTLDDLIEANPGANPDTLEMGQIISIPVTAPPSPGPSISEIYEVQEGDTMYKLSLRYNVSLSALIKANLHINPESLLPGQWICIPKTWNTYHNALYKVEFKYPIRWAKVSDTFYEGLDGFFKLSAVNSNSALRDICREEAYHKLKPYGTHPAILDITAADLPACLIVPSPDQPMEMNGQSAMLLRYPSPIIINDKCYNHLIIWADAMHIKDLIAALVIHI
ncbi:MAG: hypothetical protein K0R84_2205 [Clostridia bacterium]|jgi:TolB protein|nr:hypothetical protein [Clostridia bacterium]